MGCSLSLSFHFEHEKYICENHFIRIVFRGQKFEKWVLMLIKLPLKRYLAKAVIKSTKIFFRCKHITEFKCMIPYIIYLIYIFQRKAFIYFTSNVRLCWYLCVYASEWRNVCVCVCDINEVKCNKIPSIKYEHKIREREREWEKREYNFYVH